MGYVTKDNIKLLRRLEKGLPVWWIKLFHPDFKGYEGLCFILYPPDLEDSENLQDICCHWSGFSGWPAYPVPHSCKSPRVAYYTYSLYNIFTKYGKDRRRLAGFIADVLEGVIDTPSNLEWHCLR